MYERVVENKEEPGGGSFFSSSVFRSRLISTPTHIAFFRSPGEMVAQKDNVVTSTKPNHIYSVPILSTYKKRENSIARVGVYPSSHQVSPVCWGEVQSSVTGASHEALGTTTAAFSSSTLRLVASQLSCWY